MASQGMCDIDIQTIPLLTQHCIGPASHVAYRRFAVTMRRRLAKSANHGAWPNKLGEASHYSNTSLMIPQCFYHPAPMTRPLGVPYKKPEPRCRAVNAHVEAVQGHDSCPSLSRALRNGVGVTSTSSAGPSLPGHSSKITQSGSNTTTFYFGSTSCASVFAQEHAQSNSSHEHTPASAHGILSISASGLEGTRHCHISVGSLVISRCKQFAFLERLVRAYFVANQGSSLIGPLILNALPQMHADLKYVASQLSDPYPLLATITKNSSLPLNVPSTMLPSEFHTLFTGSSLRWEAIGLMMALAASSAQRLSPDDSIFRLENGDKINKDDFIEDMIHAANDCITLCQVHGAVNDITVWLMYNNMLIQSNCYGNNCMSPCAYLS
jgi:hypothetical protein